MNRINHILMFPVTIDFGVNKALLFSDDLDSLIDFANEYQAENHQIIEYWIFTIRNNRTLE